MTPNTEALPPLPETFTINEAEEAFVRDFCPYKGSPDPLIVWKAAWASCSAALAQRQQVPAEWTMRLDADAAETLKQTIGDDDTVSEITLSLCDGHEGRGLYVWLTEYPEEGSLLLAAAPALTAAPSAQAEPVTRFCPSCGSVGPVPSQYRDCCPDGSDARVIPEKLAQQCHDLFQLAIRAPSDPDEVAAPPVAQAEPQVPRSVIDQSWLDNKGKVLDAMRAAGLMLVNRGTHFEVIDHPCGKQEST